MFCAMGKFRGEDPFVQVYAANEDTIIHIGQLIYTNDGDQSAPKQAHEGVMMTLIQFRSLMFYLRVLEAKFMQASEIQLGNTCNIESQNNRIDETQIWTRIDNDSIVVDKNIKHEQTDTITWNELNNIISTIDEPNNMQVISVSSNTQDANRHAIFNEKWISKDQQSLAAKKTWMHKLEMYILNL